MSKVLIIILITLAVLGFLTILKFIRNNKMPIKYSLFWMIPCITVLIISLCPNLVLNIAKYLGFQTSVNLIIAIILGILLIITLLLTIIISDQKRRIVLLVQEISILKEKVNDEKR